MRLRKKAQESRNDLLMWYVICFVAVLMVTGALYGFGVISGPPGHGGSLIDSKITAAAVVDEPEETTDIGGMQNVSNSTIDENDID